MSRLEDATVPAFARHETFHPRYGWFRKALQAATGSPDAFSKESATVDLGVGKNMVRAIRFWGRAAKVLAEAPNRQRPRLPLTVPSRNGVALFDEACGLDPYLELPGSLWLLHWWMLAPRSLLPVWWLAFNAFGPVEFSGEDLSDFVLGELEERPSWGRPVASSVKKDVDCLLRMYAPRATGRTALDDLLDCPFRELGLLEAAWGDAERVRFVLGAKPTLPAAIVAFACLDYLAVAEPGARTVTVSRLTGAQGSPGRVFKLTEEALVGALVEYGTQAEAVRLASVAGVLQLTVVGDPASRAAEALAVYFGEFGRRIDGLLRLGSGPAYEIGAVPLFEVQSVGEHAATGPLEGRS